MRNQDRRSEGTSPVRRKAILAAIVGLGYLILCWHPQLMALLGVGVIERWFLDTHSLLAASDAAAAGLDPRRGNPFDFSGQPHAYSDWWYALAALGLSRADSLWLGGLLGAAFVVAAVAKLGVRQPLEILWSALIALSPPVILGFCRGNADLLIFLILSPVFLLAGATGSMRGALAVLLLIAAFGLKFYPLLAAIVLLAPLSSHRQTWFRLALILVLAGLVLISQRDNLLLYTSGKPPPLGLFTFGFPLLAQALHLDRWTSLVAILFASATCAWCWRHLPRWTLLGTRSRDDLPFIAGATLLVGCYFMTVNFSYRAVFAVWLAPFLYRAWTDASWPIAFRRLGRATSILLVFFLWADGAVCLVLNRTHGITQAQADRWIEFSLIAQQPLVAAFMLALLGFITPFVRDALRHLLHATPPDSPSAASAS